MQIWSWKAPLPKDYVDTLGNFTFAHLRSRVCDQELLLCMHICHSDQHFFPSYMHTLSHLTAQTLAAQSKTHSANLATKSCIAA